MLLWESELAPVEAHCLPVQHLVLDQAALDPADISQGPRKDEPDVVVAIVAICMPNSD